MSLANLFHIDFYFSIPIFLAQIFFLHHFLYFLFSLFYIFIFCYIHSILFFYRWIFVWIQSITRIDFCLMLICRYFGWLTIFYSAKITQKSACVQDKCVFKKKKPPTFHNFIHSFKYTIILFKINENRLSKWWSIFKLNSKSHIKFIIHLN